MFLYFCNYFCDCHKSSNKPPCGLFFQLCRGLFDLPNIFACQYLIFLPPVPYFTYLFQIQFSSFAKAPEDVGVVHREAMEVTSHPGMWIPQISVMGEGCSEPEFRYCWALRRVSKKCFCSTLPRGRVPPRLHVHML